MEIHFISAKLIFISGLTLIWKLQNICWFIFNQSQRHACNIWNTFLKILLKMGSLRYMTQSHKVRRTSCKLIDYIYKSTKPDIEAKIGGIIRPKYLYFTLFIKKIIEVFLLPFIFILKKFLFNESNINNIPFIHSFLKVKLSL